LTRELQSASTLPIKPVNPDLNKGAGAQAFNGMLGRTLLLLQRMRPGQVAGSLDEVPLSRTARTTIRLMQVRLR
jgi:hypothetical protein